MILCVPYSETYISAEARIVARLVLFGICVVLVVIPENAEMAIFCVEPTRITGSWPPFTHDSRSASLNCASVRAPVVEPSVGAATVPELKPAVEADAVVVARTPLPALSVEAIHDSIEPSERPVEAPPADEA